MWIHRGRLPLESLSIPRLYVGVDRQYHLVNRTRTRDKRNVALTAVGSHPCSMPACHATPRPPSRNHIASAWHLWYT
ncbi:protein of unknown function [Candidatus Methylomirabilis oxygeniifera]|uniref:Uncharacterized protein n=1 Tax=Methylomirabilis oxygeniifera TaxID=671143 RepID=D5MII9_METO1|nr:protein of unknown function [Candidatus Methylomirabilis oxyfera]